MQEKEEFEEVKLSALIDVPPEMVLELAVGVDTFDNICRKHGYNTSQIERLRDDPSLKARVAKSEAEFQKDGFIHKHRAAFGADSILKILISRGMDPSTPLSVALDIYKELVKTGDLVPKQALNPAQQGSGFSLIINLPQVGNQPGRTIEAHTKPLETIPDLGTGIPDLGTPVNSVDEGLVDVEALLDMAPLENVNRDVNRVLNSALALPENWDE